MQHTVVRISYLNHENDIHEPFLKSLQTTFQENPKKNNDLPHHSFKNKGIAIDVNKIKLQ